MANLLLAAIREAGHTVSVASKLRSYSKVPDIDNLRVAADDEVRRLLSHWATSGVSERPDLWFTYHPYYKAPDLIGPAVAGQLDVPYVTAEASYSSRRQADEWADMQTPVIEAVRQACVNFCLTPIDREGLGAIAAPDTLADLPAFLDTSRFCDVPAARTSHVPCRLLTVAMMRPGVKVQSYGMLAAALNALGTADWHLTVIGDGPARTEVHKLFSALPQERISWLGEQPGDRVRDELQQADVFVWPGFGEAYGLAYLEAQACGLPVVAQRTAGVPSVVCDGKTGLLTPRDDVTSYSEALTCLVSNAKLRSQMSCAAREFVHQQRTIAAAAETIDRAIARALSSSGNETLAS